MKRKIMRSKRIIYAVLIGLCTLSFARADKGKTVATVNGVKITEKQLMSKVNEKLPLITVHQRISEKRFNEIQNQILNQLIDEELLVQEAKRRGIRVSHEELMQQVQMMKSPYKTQKIFEKELAKTGQTYDQWLAKIKRRLLIRKLWKTAVNDKIQISEQDVHQYYLQHKNKFFIPDQLHLAHILISVNPGAMEKGWEEGLKKAENIYRQLSLGADFSLMARKFSSDSATRSGGGDLGWRHVGQLLPELDKVAQTLQVGQISKPIRTIYGFHILKLLDKKNGRQLSFDEIDRKKLKAQLEKKKRQMLGSQLIDSLRQKAKIKIFTIAGN